MKDDDDFDDEKNNNIDVVDIQLSLVISNISKRTNVKSLLLAGIAFNCKTIYVVGQGQGGGGGQGQKGGAGAGGGQQEEDYKNITERGKQKPPFDDDAERVEGQQQQQQQQQSLSSSSSLPLTNNTNSSFLSLLPSAIQRQIEIGAINMKCFHKFKDFNNYIQQVNENNNNTTTTDDDDDDDTITNTTTKICLIGVEIDETSHVLDFCDDKRKDKETTCCFSKIISQFLRKEREHQSQSHNQHEQEGKPKIVVQVAILMGNEGTGIHPNHMKCCHGLLRIPQYYGTSGSDDFGGGDNNGSGGTASLNVTVAASIVLHRFHNWINTRQQKSRQDDNKTIKVPYIFSPK